jgi:hypothetical protein
MQRGKGENEQRGKQTLPFSPFLLFYDLGWAGGTFNVSTF